MQSFKRIFRTVICIFTAFAAAVSMCMLNLTYAEFRRPFDPDETTVGETDKPPVETDPSIETTPETSAVIIDPPETSAEPPVTGIEPPVTSNEPPVSDTEPPVSNTEPPNTSPQITEPPVNKEKIQLSFYQCSLEKGEGIQLKVTLVNSTAVNPNIGFYSNNTAVAKVDASGYITATGVGETEIIAFFGDLIAYAKVTVIEKKIDPENIVLANSSFILNIGGIAQIEATLLPAEISNDYIFTYESSNSDVAEVSEEGVISAVGEGEAEIVVSAAGLSQTVSVKVTAEVAFNSSRIDGYLYNDLGVPMAGSTVYIDDQSAVADKNGYFCFDSVNQKIVSVYVSDYPEKKCAYTVLKDATIYLLCQNNLLTMLPSLGELQGRLPISKIIVDSSDIILNEGEMYSLNYTYQPKNATVTDISYVSSNPLVAQVGQIDGVITAKSVGEAIITLTVNGGQASVSLNITVNPQNSTKYSVLIVVIEGLLFAGAVFVIATYYKRYQMNIQEDADEDEDDYEDDLHDIE